MKLNLINILIIINLFTMNNGFYKYKTWKKFYCEFIKN